MRVRVSVATLRRIERLSQPAVVNRGGLLVVPRVLDCDEWERQVFEWHQRMLMIDPQMAATLYEPEPLPPPASYRVVR